MAQSKLDPSTLSAFENAAAGHDGVLSDPTGALVIKPCTAAEIAFYESANADHPALAAYMPTFMGTLELNTSATTAALVDSATAAAPAIPEAGAAAKDTVIGSSSASTPGLSGATTPAEPAQGTAATLSADDPGPMKGKKLDTDTSIVLENVAAGFKQPNILDLKLGARLYDDGTAPAKRARLDKVAAETTSSSLGFRIAGMRVWQGEGGGEGNGDASDEFSTLDESSRYKTFNKLYGRAFSAESIANGFKEYLLVPSAGVETPLTRATVSRFLRDVRAVQRVLESEETRMYSASLLFVYEGDAGAAREAQAALDAHEAKEKQEGDVQTATSAGAKGWNEEDDDEVEADFDDDDEDKESPKFAIVKLIDFAHASWTPGQGSDENVLRGVRSIVKVFEELEKELQQQE